MESSALHLVIIIYLIVPVFQDSNTQSDSLSVFRKVFVNNFVNNSRTGCMVG